MLRDQFMLGLCYDTVKRRLVQKKAVSFTSVVEEGVARALRPLPGEPAYPHFKTRTRRILSPCIKE